MGVEVMEVAKVMRAGITIPVGPALRALFREADKKVEVQALVNRQALDKTERWGWSLEPTHLSFVTGNAPTLAFGEGGATTLAPDDVLLGSVTIRGLALELLRHFLAENEGKVELHLGPSMLSVLGRYLGNGSSEELELSVVARDGYGGYDELKVMSGGGASVKVSWGEASWWDGWVVSPKGAVEYVGTVDGPRYLPLWLSRALEKAKAKGA
jgi:hypothetical protein